MKREAESPETRPEAHRRAQRSQRLESAWWVTALKAVRRHDGVNQESSSHPCIFKSSARGAIWKNLLAIENRYLLDCKRCLPQGFLMTDPTQ